jgi:carbamoyltransferase
MRVLGINCYLHDTSAALVEDGRITWAVAEERLSRIHKDNSFPHHAIRGALAKGGLRLSDLDAVAFGWNRGGATPLHTLRATLTDRIPRTGRMIADSLLAMGREIHFGNGERVLARAFGSEGGVPILHIDHHEAHAWSAYAPSGFEEALVLVMDGRGARDATALYHAKGGGMRLVRRYVWPDSLGLFYEAFTDLLGFRRHSDEWKVMGLAAYGEPSVDLRDVLRVTKDGYKVDAHLLFGQNWNDLSPLIARFGPRRDPERGISDQDRALAASVQRALEQAIFAVVSEGIRLTGCRKVCLAGGVALNSKANGRLLASGLIDDLFVQPAATDDGTAVGAALAAHAALGVPVPRHPMRDVYLGPSFDDAEIAAELARYRIASAHVEDVERVTAGLIAQGFIVGWFQGRMEFGPRALGNRSILADPRQAKIRDRVNECIKFRESWRPFAPSCLAEAASEYFEGCREAPAMTVTYDVVPSKRSVIPAVTHADNTARVHTVARTSNARYWELIHAFGALTGVPVVLNTSFNLKGEPIVCTPKDAVRTFYSSGLDFLVIGSTIVPKAEQWVQKRDGGGGVTRAPLPASGARAAE